MTNGTSQGLFVIIAVVIFGIFVGISYLIFQDSLRPKLTSIFDTSLEEASDLFRVNYLNNDYLNNYRPVSLPWDEKRNNPVQPYRDHNADTLWSYGYNGGLASHKEGYHAFLDTYTFSQPTIAFHNKNHLINPALKDRWLGFSHSWFAKSDFMKKYYDSKEIKIVFDLYSDKVDGNIAFTLLYLDENGTNSNYFDVRPYVEASATKQNSWETKQVSLKITDEMVDRDKVKGLKLYIYGHLNDPQASKYIKNIRVYLK